MTPPNEIINLIFGPYFPLIWKYIFSLWWAWLPFVMLGFFVAVWQRWRKNLYEIKDPSILLEVKIPREIYRGPKAMEQVLANFYSLRNSADSFMEKYWEGEFERWFGLEIASFGGDIRFYIYTPKRHKTMVEAHIYAQYPDVEIVEAEDYTNRYPQTMQDITDMDLDMYGTEIIQGKDDAYPIRTYIQFESNEDAQNLDPISALVENLSRTKVGESLWLQILIRPAPYDWTDKAKKVVEEIKNSSMGTMSEAASGSDSESRMMFQRLSPGEIDTMKAIEQNMSKPAFETVIRQLYFAPRKSFNMNFGKRAVFSCLNQYKSETLNYFAPKISTRTIVFWSQFPFFFSKRRRQARKSRILIHYKDRYMPDNKVVGKLLTSNPFYINFKTKPFIMSVEELATIFHFPTTAVVTAPFIERIESKKIGPPAGLSIFSEDDSGPDFEFGIEEETPPEEIK